MNDHPGPPPPLRSREREVASDLVRMALALLDRADDPLAPARLQSAIDAAGQPHG